MTATILYKLGSWLLILFTLTAPWLLPLFVDSFWVDIYSEILIWSLLAASVNILLGYVGLLSFGQALFFGFGMYGVAIGITKFDFSFWPAFGFGVALATGMAAVAGSLAVRLTWHYFAIITVIFSLIFYFTALSWKPVTGGDDGLPFSVPPMIATGDFELTMTNPNTQYFFIVMTVGFCYWLINRVINSPLGRAFITVRENDSRAALIGLNVYRIRLSAFIFAGFIAGVAGALFALFGRYASASYMFYHVSGEAVVWAIIGGVGTLFGPIVGTGLMIVLREELSSVWDHYLLLVGVAVIVTVIFAPQGLGGAFKILIEKFVNRRNAGKETGGS